ncbi:Vacuolar protein sorting-associated protein 35A [Dendrobium catenatum]|uniref:Vacuolar protein sorting-associated protein 35A n=1 Tax=Dendrobium catenatum TaxID=906689 RepID=A0A2I0V920_9ASPA|nr:Vacuolar protein sorting-associated protein 35A [Dendrobium catenatum]
MDDLKSIYQILLLLKQDDLGEGTNTDLDAYVIQSIMKNNTYISTADKVEALFDLIKGLIKDMDEIQDEDDFKEGKNSVACLIHMLYNDDPEEMLEGDSVFHQKNFVNKRFDIAFYAILLDIIYDSQLNLTHLGNLRRLMPPNFGKEFSVNVNIQEYGNTDIEGVDYTNACYDGTATLFNCDFAVEKNPAKEVDGGIIMLQETIWASVETVELVAHMRNGDQSFISQFDVQALLLDYMKKYNLRDPHRKSQIIRDLNFETSLREKE